MIEVKPSGQACGATVTGLDLSTPLDAATIQAVRAAWLEHHVLAFPDQTLSDADLERYRAVVWRVWQRTLLRDNRGQ